MSGLGVLIVGVVMLVGVGVQGYLSFEKDLEDGPHRVIAAMLIGAAFFLGALVYGFFKIIDENDFTLWEYAAILGRTLVFGIVVTIKAYFSPIIFSSMVSWTVYHFFEDGKFIYFLWIGDFIGWVLDTNEPWIGIVYTVFWLLFSLGGSLYDSWLVDESFDF